MSGRHTSRTGKGPAIRSLPKTLKLVARLAPRQLNDELALARVELKRKAAQVGVAGAFFGVALVFLMLLVIALVVAAILGLATIMPGWLAALIVAAVFLLIVALGALIGTAKFRAAMPLVPEDTIRGIKHDLGIAKEGSAFDESILDPNSPQPRRPRPKRKLKRKKRRLRKRPRRPPRTPMPPRHPPKLNCGAGWTSAASTLPVSATNLARSLTSRSRGRHCWRLPTRNCRKAVNLRPPSSPLPANRFPRTSPGALPPAGRTSWRLLPLPPSSWLRYGSCSRSKSLRQ